MEAEDKKVLKNNIIKFIIGCILLWFSFYYIQWHPAEKVSIFSWFEVLRQRISVYFHSVTNTNSDALKKKYDYEKTYEELIQMAKSSTCESASAITTQINETYFELKKEKLSGLDNYLPWYNRKASEYKNMIDNCK